MLTVARMTMTKTQNEGKNRLAEMSAKVYNRHEQHNYFIASTTHASYWNLNGAELSLISVNSANSGNLIISLKHELWSV